MPTWESAANRGARRARTLLRRVGEELRVARIGAGLSTRRIGAFVGVSHTHVRNIEAGLAPHIDLDLLARLASVLGYELSLGLHPVGSPLRDRAHLAILARLAARMHASIRWRTEVPVPIAGDQRSADGVATGRTFDATVEAETRLDDVQASVRKLRAKQRDLGTTRAILLLADTRHNRRAVAATPALRAEFPIHPRAALHALARGDDPGGDCLLIL